jgi:hypothetical protein
VAGHGVDRLGAPHAVDPHGAGVRQGPDGGRVAALHAHDHAPLVGQVEGGPPPGTEVAAEQEADRAPADSSADRGQDQPGDQRDPAADEERHGQGQQRPPEGEGGGRPRDVPGHLRGVDGDARSGPGLGRLLPHLAHQRPHVVAGVVDRHVPPAAPPGPFGRLLGGRLVGVDRHDPLFGCAGEVKLGHVPPLLSVALSFRCRCRLCTRAGSPANRAGLPPRS